MINKNWKIRRGDLYLADLNPYTGSEQGGKRPIVVLSNNIGNRFSPTVIIAPFTTQQDNSPLPTHVHIHKSVYSETEDSLILLEQIRVIDRKRISKYLGKLSFEQMRQVDTSLLISVGLTNSYISELRTAAIELLRNNWKTNRRKTRNAKTIVANG